MQGVHKLDGFPHCVDAAAIEERTVRHLTFLKRKCLAGFPQFGAAQKNDPG